VRTLAGSNGLGVVKLIPKEEEEKTQGGGELFGLMKTEKGDLLG